MGATVSTQSQKSSVSKSISTAATTKASTSSGMDLNQEIDISVCPGDEVTNKGEISTIMDASSSMTSAFSNVADMKFDSEDSILMKAKVAAETSGIPVGAAAVANLDIVSSMMLKVDVMAQMDMNCSISTNASQSIKFGSKGPCFDPKERYDAINTCIKNAFGNEKLAKMCIEGIGNSRAKLVNAGKITANLKTDAYGSCVGKNGASADIASTATASLDGTTSAVVEGFNPAAFLGSLAMIGAVMVAGAVAVMVIMGSNAKGMVKGIASVGAPGITAGGLGPKQMKSMMFGSTVISVLLGLMTTGGFFLYASQVSVSESNEGRSWWPYLKKGTDIMALSAAVDELKRIIGKLRSKTFTAQAKRADKHVDKLNRSKGFWETLKGVFDGEDCDYANVMCGSKTCDACVAEKTKCLTDKIIVQCQFVMRQYTEAMWLIRSRDKKNSPTMRPAFVAGMFSSGVVIAWTFVTISVMASM